MSINTHTFFCSDLDCEMEVMEHGMMCEAHTVNECPGCGMEACLSGEGFCECCSWRLQGAETVRGTGPDFWQSSLRENCECHHSPLCRECEVYYGYDDEGPYDGRTYNCTDCSRDFKNKYWRNQSLCQGCENKAPAVNQIKDDIAHIREKIEHWSRGMTETQIATWHDLLFRRELRLKHLQCRGCQDNDLSQLAHMVQDGCLDERERIPWEDYDKDDLRKLDRQ
jgi:hypothetical protein